MDSTGHIPFSAWAGRNISLTPSRGGFAIEGRYPNYGVTYFEGNPVKLVTAISSCSQLATVTDGGFAGFEQSPQSKLVVHLVGGGWDLEDSRFEKREWVALPIPDRVLLLTSKFQLYDFQRGGSVKLLAGLHWLAPGWHPRVNLDSDLDRRPPHSCDQFGVLVSTQRHNWNWLLRAGRSSRLLIRRTHFQETILDWVRCHHLTRRPLVSHSREKSALGGRLTLS